MKVKTIIMSLTGVVIIMCLIMMFRTAPRFVLSIQSFDVNTNKICVGGSSDICFDLVPHDFMEVEAKEGHFEWTINNTYRTNDSLMYYTINNVNPNFHQLEDGQISIQLPDQTGHPRHTLTIPIAEIKSLLNGPKSKYVLLRTLLQMRATRDTTIDYTAIKQLRSCLARKTEKSPWGIVILDKYTTLVGSDGQRVPYVMAGRTDSIEGSKVPANTFKVQFYRMSDYTIMPEDIDDDMFHIGRMHYLAKPVLVTTKWGAGHALVSTRDNGLHVTFPKALTYAERIDSLRTYAKSTSGVLTFQQNDGSFPVSHNLLLPAYSNALSQDVCNLRITDDTLGVIIASDSILLMSSQNSLLPKLQSIKLSNGGSGTVNAEVGIIGKGFILSYMWIPWMVFLILFVAYPFLTSRYNNEKGITPLAGELPSHFKAILFIALAYGMCKTLIAFKLSFTYPYFDKMTGIMPLAVSLMLLLVFNVSLVFNQAFVKREDMKWRRWVAPIVSVVCLAIIGAAFKMMDDGFNSETISSYYPHELGGFNFLRWSDAVGMNDTHRTVPFMLLLANIVTTLLLLALMFVDTKKLTSKLKQIDVKINFWFSLLGAIVIFGITFIPGNFTTAAITLAAVMGLCWTLSKVDYSLSRKKVKDNKNQSRLKRILTTPLGNKSFWITMLACFCYFAAATFPPYADKGYLTNFAGYMVMGIIVCLMVQKTLIQAQSSQVERNGMTHYHKGMRNAILLVIAALAVFYIWGIPLLLKANTIDYNRASRRFLSATQFEKFQDSGYRYAVSDAEFMIVMSHYMFNCDGSDPLSNTEHMLHPSLSTGQSPVILNDVSIQSSFFDTYAFWAFVVFFALLALLAWLVFKHTLYPDGELDTPRMWCLMAILLWISTTVYLYVSYSGYIPFTGRLVPGFGVDAVGEALETSILLAFMTATTLHMSSTKNK